MSNFWIPYGNDTFGLPGNEADGFSYSLSLSGDGTRLAVGAPRADNGVGAVFNYIYNDSEDAWLPYGANEGKVQNEIIDGGSGPTGTNYLAGIDVSLNYDGSVLGVCTFNDENQVLGGRDTSNLYLVSLNDDNVWSSTLINTEENRLKYIFLSNDAFFDDRFNLPTGTITALTTNDSRLATGIIREDNTTARSLLFPVGSYSLAKGVSMGVSEDAKAVIVGDWFNDKGNIQIYIYNDGATPSGEYELRTTISGNSPGAENLGLSADIKHLEDNTYILCYSYQDNTTTGQGFLQVDIFNDDETSIFTRAVLGETELGVGNSPTAAKLSQNGDKILVRTFNDHMVFEWDNIIQYNKLGNDTIFPYDINLLGQSFTQSNLSISADGTSLAIGNDFGVPDDLPDNFTKGNVTLLQLESTGAPCFLAGSLVETDQGLVAIEKIQCGVHTIRGEDIEKVSKTMSLNISSDDYLITLEKDSLGLNMPTQKTTCTPLHKIYYNGKKVEARQLALELDGVVKVPYNRQHLYNVQLSEYSFMIVNGLKTETLHPENAWAKKGIRLGK